MERRRYELGATVGNYVPAKDADRYVGEYVYIVATGDGRTLATETSLEHAKSTAKNYTFKGEVVYIYKLVGVMEPTARWY